MNAYLALEKLKEPIGEDDFVMLIEMFRTEYLSEVKYRERLSLHRNPNTVRNEILQDLYNYLRNIQNREEMRDTDDEAKIARYVTTVITEIWKSDKRIRSLYEAVDVYCRLKSKDLNTIAVHIAEYRVLDKQARSIRRELDRHADPPNPIVDKSPQGKVNGSKLEKQVLPIHFEDRSGVDFERLVFAFLNRTKNWEKIEWLGQPGDDDGRDIWGVFNGETYCYQCANYRQLSFEKAKQDINKLVRIKAIPDYYTVVCGGRVSVRLRTKIENYGKQVGLQYLEVWSGAEFEEKLRSLTPEIVRRFVHGEEFPEVSKKRLLNSGNINQLEFYRNLFTRVYDTVSHHAPFTCLVNQKEMSTEDLPEIIFEKGGIIVGKSGCGKSALAAKVALNFLEQGKGIPVILEAKYYDVNLNELLKNTVEKYGFSSRNSFWECCIASGNEVLLVIDGLNECSAFQKARIVEELTEHIVKYRCKCLVTTQNNDDLFKSFDFTYASVMAPDLAVKKAIAGLNCADDVIEKLVPLLKVVTTNLEAKIIGEIGSIGIKTISRFTLFELFIRKKLADSATNSMRLLSHIAAQLSSDVSFSLSTRKLETILTENSISKDVLQVCMESSLLVQGPAKVSFSHEMFMNFFVADSIIRYSENDSQNITNEIQAPKNREKRLMIIGAIENHRVLNEVLESIEDVNLLFLLTIGEGGEYCRIWADRKFAEIIPKIKAEVNSLEFEIVSDEYNPVRIKPDSIHVWTNQEKAFIHAIPFLLQKEVLVAEFFEIIGELDAVCNHAHSQLLDEARQKKINLRSQIFSCVYVGVYHDKIPSAWIFSTLHSGFATFENRNEIRKETIANLLSKSSLKFGEFYLLLVLCRYSDLLKLFYKFILNSLTGKWRSLPYHLRNEILDCVAYCYDSEEQRLALVKALNAIHEKTIDSFESAHLFEALSAIGALEEDALAYVETVREQINNVLSNPDDPKSWSDASGLYYAQFDHPYDRAFTEAIAELNPENKKRFFKIALQGYYSSFFTVSLVIESISVLNSECCPYLLRWTEKPFIDDNSPQSALSLFFICHIFLGRFSYPIELRHSAQMDYVLKTVFACAEIYYWLNRIDMNLEARKKVCNSSLEVLFHKDSTTTVGCLWETERSLNNSGIYRQFQNIPLVTLSIAFPNHIAAACRTAIRNPDKQKDIFKFAKAEEIVKYAILLLGRYGNIYDLGLLRELSNHPIYGESAVSSIKELETS